MKTIASLLLGTALAALAAPASAQETAAPAAVAAVAAPVPGETAPDAEFDAKIRSYLERNPDVVMGIVRKRAPEVMASINEYVEKQQAEQQAASDANVLAMSKDLTSNDGSMILGNPDGKVQMVYVLDAACGYCHRMSPVLDEVIAANPDLRIVQRWVPFLTPSSTYAGILAQMVFEQDRPNYYAFYKGLMSTEGQLSDASVEATLRQAVGDKADEFIRQAAGGDTRTRGTATMEANMGLAQKGAIQGTPFFMIVGAGSQGLVRGATSAEQLNAAIKTARDAG